MINDKSRRNKLYTTLKEHNGIDDFNKWEHLVKVSLFDYYRKLDLQPPRGEQRKVELSITDAETGMVVPFVKFTLATARMVTASGGYRFYQCGKWLNGKTFHKQCVMENTAFTLTPEACVVKENVDDSAEAPVASIENPLIHTPPHKLSPAQQKQVYDIQTSYRTRKGSGTTANPVIVAAACKDKNGLIYVSARHWDPLMGEVLDATGGKVDPPEQGFIDQFDNWYDRKEALAVVLASGQYFDVERNGCNDELYSEGLY